MTKRYRAPEPPLQGVEFKDYYAEDQNPAGTYFTPNNKYLDWAVQLERKARKSKPTAPPSPKQDFLIDPNLLTGTTPPPTFEQSMAEGGGNPIDPGWCNLGNLDGNMDDLVNSDLNLIHRPENRTIRALLKG